MVSSYSLSIISIYIQTISSEEAYPKLAIVYNMTELMPMMAMVLHGFGAQVQGGPCLEVFEKG